MKKEPDLHWRSRLVKSFILMFGPFHIIGLIYPFHILWATLATVICAPLAVWLADRVGERSTNLLYGLGRETFQPHERLAGELDKIRHSKRQKDFDRALYLVNQVIDKAPDLPEALFLKAQILWEGFGNQAAAGYLKRVLRLVKVGEPLHRWALSYHEQVIGMKQIRGQIFILDISPQPTRIKPSLTSKRNTRTIPNITQKKSIQLT